MASHVVEDDHVMLRKWIVTHILDTEKVYVGILDLLFEVGPFLNSALSFDSILEISKTGLTFACSFLVNVNCWIFSLFVLFNVECHSLHFPVKFSCDFYNFVHQLPV